jgi:Holliday junction resolvasome RuvABC endonuclease subunit
MLIGIDLGTQQLGYAIIESHNCRIKDKKGDYKKSQIVLDNNIKWYYGILNSKKSKPLSRRQHLMEQFENLFKEQLLVSEKQPIIAIEEGYRGSFLNAAIALAEIKGCFIEFARRNDIMLYSYNASTVMKHIGVSQRKGKKRDELKKEIRKEILDKFPEVDATSEQDAIDAIAVAWCCYLENKI